MPSLNTLYPVPGSNVASAPDRAGNPSLLPEQAHGIDIALERYLSAGGVMSVNLFHRRIRDLIRNVTSLEDVAWADQPRWASRPRNLGDATAEGVEFDAKFRLTELREDLLPLNLRMNLSLYRSRVDSVPGPDNRIDQQPHLTGNLGADYRFAGTGWTVGGSLGVTPGYRTQLSELQSQELKAAPRARCLRAVAVRCRHAAEAVFVQPRADRQRQRRQRAAGFAAADREHGWPYRSERDAAAGDQALTRGRAATVAPMSDLHTLTACELAEAYRTRRVGPMEVARDVLRHIGRWEPHLHATYALDPEAALVQAEASQARWLKGAPLGALDGVPAMIKENIATKGVPVPLGTAATELVPAAEDAPPAARLREAGAVILGKTTMPDYGMLSSGLSSFHALTRNPWDLTKNPGGSSARC